MIEIEGINISDLESYLEKDIFLLGLIVSRWMDVESNTHRLIMDVAEIKNHPVSLALTSQLSGPSMAEVLVAISRSYSESAPQYLKVFGHYEKIHSACRENRNLAVHGALNKSDLGIEPEIKVIQKLSSGGKLRVMTYEITSIDLVRVAVEISRLASFGVSLVNSFKASRKNPLIVNKISFPPIPRKLTDTLRQVSPSEFTTTDGSGVWAQ